MSATSDSNEDPSEAWLDRVNDDEYDAVLPVTIDSRNANYYVIDSEGVIIAGPMGRSCAYRCEHNINRANPRQADKNQLVLRATE